MTIHGLHSSKTNKYALTKSRLGSIKISTFACMRRIIQIAIGVNNTQLYREYAKAEKAYETPKDIYFYYADSDVQTLLSTIQTKGINISSGIELNAKLLLLFKPPTSRLLISASSVCSSLVTTDFVQKYRTFFIGESPHISILRKESSWTDYFSKREYNTRTLSGQARYRGFFDPNFRGLFNDLSVVRKFHSSGKSTSDKWNRRAEELLPLIVRNYCNLQIDLKGMSEEILGESIFVWEAIESGLLVRGVMLPSWDSQLRYALLESYLNGFSAHFLFPFNDDTGIRLETANFYYLNIRLLNLFIDRAGLRAIINDMSPAELHSSLDSQELLRYKEILAGSPNEYECLVNANRYAKYLKKALRAYV